MSTTPKITKMFPKIVLQNRNDMAKFVFSFLICAIAPEQNTQATEQNSSIDFGLIEMKTNNGEPGLFWKPTYSLKDWQFSLINIDSLTNLDLSKNRFLTGSSLSKLTNLRTLTLYNHREICGEALLVLTNLTSLNLADNGIIRDSHLKELTNLTNLELRQSSVITDEAVSVLTNLTTLGIGWNNKITEDCIEKLTNLAYLDLYQNSKIVDEDLLKLPNFLKVRGWFGHNRMRGLQSVSSSKNGSIIDRGEVLNSMISSDVVEP